LYNDARDVAFTRPGVFLPQSIYPDHFRDLLLSSESVLLYANLFTDSGQWNIELGAGEPRIDQFGEAEIDNASDEEIVVGRIMYEDGGGVWRAGISAIEGKISFDNDISSILGFPYPAIETEAQLTQYIASFQYNIDDWTFTGEYMIKITETDSPIILLPTPFGVIPLDIDIKETGEAYYLQAQRRINSNWSVMSRWDVDYVDKDDRSGNDTEPSLLGTLGYGQYSKDYTLGLRWDIQENIMLNTEYHYVKGASWLSLLDNPNGPSSKYWNMLSIAISYRF
jgi:hypothetical protein